jgi:hypothetical protein
MAPTVVIRREQDSHEGSSDSPRELERVRLSGESIRLWAERSREYAQRSSQ